jgi:hypothetical protein
MDLATLQERYPHGSEWRWRISSSEPLRTVVGWEPGPVGTVIWKVNGTPQIVRCSPGTIDDGFDRVVPPPPCPITEPVTLYPYETRAGVNDKVRWVEGGWGVPLRRLTVGPITVWPPGEAPDPQTTRGGIWTWDGAS